MTELLLLDILGIFLLWTIPILSVIFLDKYHWFHSNIDPMIFKGCIKCEEE